MTYAGVVVLFNPDEKVINNINTYVKNLKKLYVVDNTPNKDNSYLFKNKKIEYIANKKNEGIAHALNIGANKAIKEKYDFLLTMDQDSSFPSGSVKKLINYIENNSKYILKEVGIISAYHLTPQNEFKVAPKVGNPLLVMTSGNFVNLKAHKKIGGFKDWMFIDCVDFDYCLNMRRHGYEIVQLFDAKLNHNLGNTEKKRLFGKTMFVSHHSPIRRYYMVRNRHYLYDMYHEEFPDYCNAEISRTKKEWYKIILFEKNKIRKSMMMFKGYRDYKKGIKGEYNGKK